MVSAPFPGSGQDDGEQPPQPGVPEDDWDADADMARFLDDVEAGRERIPAADPRGPAVLFTLGEAGDVAPVELANMAGPDGLGGDTFSQDAMADALRPGPLLFALT